MKSQALLKLGNTNPTCSQEPKTIQASHEALFEPTAFQQPSHNAECVEAISPRNPRVSQVAQVVSACRTCRSLRTYGCRGLDFRMFWGLGFMGFSCLK